MQKIGLPIVPAIKLDNKNIGGHCTPLHRGVEQLLSIFERVEL